MKVATQKINTIATNPWFITVGGISSIVAFMWFLYDKYSDKPVFLPTIVFASTFAVLFVGYIYSIRVRTENIALRGLWEILFEINRIYRNKLREVFSSKANPITNSNQLLAEEEATLKGMCQRIDTIFTCLTGRKCMVTVKLVTKEGTPEKCFAHTYVRSQDICKRDDPVRTKYVIGSGENTGFDAALRKRSDGLPSHFFSANLPQLEKQNHYSNQRQHYSRYYRSAIVVPIQGVNKGKESTQEEFDRIGFLCVDTMSLNRLNDSYHVFMLAALADQMYNFMSLMRGSYTVSVEQQQT